MDQRGHSQADKPATGYGLSVFASDVEAFTDDVDRLADPIDPKWVLASLEWFPRFRPVPDW